MIKIIIVKIKKRKKKTVLTPYRDSFPVMGTLLADNSAILEHCSISL